MRKQPFWKFYYIKITVSSILEANINLAPSASPRMFIGVKLRGIKSRIEQTDWPLTPKWQTMKTTFLALQVPFKFFFNFFAGFCQIWAQSSPMMYNMSIFVCKFPCKLQLKVPNLKAEILPSILHFKIWGINVPLKF